MMNPNPLSVLKLSVKQDLTLIIIKFIKLLLFTVVPKLSTSN